MNKMQEMDRPETIPGVPKAPTHKVKPRFQMLKEAAKKRMRQGPSKPYQAIQETQEPQSQLDQPFSHGEPEEAVRRPMPRSAKAALPSNQPPNKPDDEEEEM
jgi:hypothetical protein